MHTHTMTLTFTHVAIREENTRSSIKGQARRRVTRVVASFRGEDGYEYRKAFEAKRGSEPEVPKSGTHHTLEAKRRQF